MNPEDGFFSIGEKKKKRKASERKDHPLSQSTAYKANERKNQPQSPNTVDEASQREVHPHSQAMASSSALFGQRAFEFLSGVLSSAVVVALLLGYFTLGLSRGQEQTDTLRPPPPSRPHWPTRGALAELWSRQSAAVAAVIHSDAPLLAQPQELEILGREHLSHSPPSLGTTIETSGTVRPLQKPQGFCRLSDTVAVCQRLQRVYDELQTLFLLFHVATRHLNTTCSGLQCPPPAGTNRSTGAAANAATVAAGLTLLQAVKAQALQRCGVPGSALEMGSLRRVRARLLDKPIGNGIPRASSRSTVLFDAADSTLYGSAYTDLIANRAWERDSIGSAVEGADVLGKKGEALVQETIPLPLSLPEGTVVGVTSSARLPMLVGLWPAWSLFTRKTRSAISLSKLREHGKETPEKAPQLPSVTIMLQYYQQPVTMDQVIESYSRCIQGLPGSESVTEFNTFPVEFLANVDQPAEWKAWIRHWRATQVLNRTAGNVSADWDFMSVVFRHNSHEIRGYNNLVRSARGDMVSMVQDDDLAPKSCLWLNRVQTEFATRPRLACIGYNTGVDFEGSWINWNFDDWRFALDKVTGIRLNFMQWVDIGPMTLTRASWLSLGGIDEAMGPQGQSGIMSDWHFSQRVWISGSQISLLFRLSPELDIPRVALGTTHTGTTLSGAYRSLNADVNSYLLDILTGITKGHVLLELSRSNLLLNTVQYP